MIFLWQILHSTLRSSWDYSVVWWQAMCRFMDSCWRTFPQILQGIFSRVFSYVVRFMWVLLCSSSSEGLRNYPHIRQSIGLLSFSDWCWLFICLFSDLGSNFLWQILHWGLILWTLNRWACFWYLNMTLSQMPHWILLFWRVITFRVFLSSEILSLSFVEVAFSSMSLGSGDWNPDFSSVASFPSEQM